MKKEEESHQAALISWFQLAYPDLQMLLYHVPNGGKRESREAMKLRSMGVKSGVSDLFLSIPNSRYHGLYIEMKSVKGKMTSNQYKFINLVKDKGYDVLVCKDWEDGKNYILRYLNE